MDLPKPAPGLVISYAYLWRDQIAAGAREGRKDRPCAIITGFAIPEALQPNPHHYIDYPSQSAGILLLLAFVSILPSMISSAVTLLVARRFPAKVT